MSSSSVLESREREQSILDRLPQVRLLAQKLHRRCPANVLLEYLVRLVSPAWWRPPIALTAVEISNSRRWPNTESAAPCSTIFAASIRCRVRSGAS